jgi:membrane protein implicated in regulation of membrane protease activity
MNIIELLILVFIISGGHFLGIALESKLGLIGWFAGCVLGIGISLLFIMLVRLIVKRLTSAHSDERGGRGDVSGHRDKRG